MSAILARINFDGAPIARDSFCSAFEVMAQYGGDGSDIWSKGSVALGQHLLRFTPESSYEKQPHHWDEAVIVADARIDNRDELCSRFRLSQAEAAKTPDSHLILRAYRLWAENCTAHLLGDFAFAIWDLRRQCLFCARDHIGTRPIFYYRTPSTCVVATDIRALQAFPDVNCDLDEREVASYLIWPNPIGQRTFFKHLELLYPGQQMCVSPAGLTLQTHWSADNAPDVRYKAVAEYAEHFRSVLEIAVAARVRTDYPVGAHLSGGLDSTGVTVLANRQLRKNGRSLDMTYTWSPSKSEAYPPVRRDERDRIEMVCRQEDIQCHYGTATGQGFREVLARDIAVELAINLFEELPVLAHAGERGIRAILTGWGGDEAATFDGRGYLAYLLRRGHLIHVARITRHHTGLRRPISALRFLFRHAVIPALPDTLYNRVDPYQRLDRQPLYIHPAFAARFPETAENPLPFLREVAHPRRMQERIFDSMHLANRMTTWAVWSSAYRLVHTYPLVDRRVLEFALGLPPELLFQQGTWRYLFRETLKDVLPPFPTKADPMNERKRLDCWLECWHILAGEVRAGQWLQHDVPWLALDQLRTKLLAVPDEMTDEQVPEFVALTPAVRAWHLWQRYGNNFNY